LKLEGLLKFGFWSLKFLKTPAKGGLIMEKTTETASPSVASDAEFEVWTLKFFWILDFEV